MPGNILNSANREKILVGLLYLIETAQTRQVLIAIWRIGKLALHEDSTRMETLTNALQYQNAELGFTPTLRPMKGGKPDA